MPKRCSAPTPRTSSAKSEYNIQPPGTENVPGGSDCRQSSESFRPPFSKGGAVEGAKPSSPSADGEILLSALSFCSFAKQSVLFSLRLHGQRKSVVQIRSFLWLTPLSAVSAARHGKRAGRLFSLPEDSQSFSVFFSAPHERDCRKQNSREKQGETNRASASFFRLPCRIGSRFGIRFGIRRNSSR